MTQLTAPQAVEHWIGGSPRPPSSGCYFEDRNPLDNSLFAMVAHGDARDIEQAVITAQAAFETFGRSLAKEREQILHRAADLLERRRDMFIDALIAALCGQRMKRVTLELGGKSPLVVKGDADIDKAAAAATHGIFTYQGQICMGSSRVFVERAIAAEFTARFTAAAAHLGMGDLRDPETVIGPIINERQRNRVRTHIEDARSNGAGVLCGGHWRQNRCEPTILTDVSDKMRVFTEETFGPVVSIYTVNSLDQAINAANTSGYGLSAGIFSSDLSSAMEFARRIRSGMVHINGSTLHDEPHVPFGGVGDSGFGREGSDEDIANMTEWKWLTMPQ